MKICYNSIQEEIKQLVNTKAKYQKVMLLFDDYVSNLDILQIYREIKESCIFNQGNIKDVDKQELNNGYRMIIYLCDANSFLKTNLNKDEFINVFCPRGNEILPYFLNEENQVSSHENFLILNNQDVDVRMFSSICFNQFFSYLTNILGMNKQDVDLKNQEEITQRNMIELMESVDKNMKFLDIEIIKKCNISYEQIVLVDLILIDAFFVFFSAIKNQPLSLVDVYKIAKDDNDLIDKFYSILNNEAVVNLIILNYHCLTNYCLKQKEKILNCLNVFNFSHEDFEKLNLKIKEFAKVDDGILIYLYLYNIFGT